MRTKRELKLRCGHGHEAFCVRTIPAGTEVRRGPADGMGNPTYVIPNPAKFGINEWDAIHHYMYVPAEEVES